MNWKAKALVQRTLDRLPAPVSRLIYTRVQQTVGGLRNFDPTEKVKQGLRLLEAFNRAKQSVAGMEAVEIGTGWVPTVPMLFWLNGLSSCHTYDIVDLMSPKLVSEVSSSLIEFCQHPYCLGSQSAFPFVSERLVALRELRDRGADAAEILSYCQISPHAPADAGATAHPD